MSNKICNHPAIKYAADMAAICRPLEQLNINYFAHVRVDNYGRFSALNNKAEFMEHYLSNKYFNADIHTAQTNKFGNYVIWDALERRGESEKMHLEASTFGIQHTFTIIEKNSHGSDYYHFANNSDNKAINQVYLTNIDLLELFIKHFNENINQSKLLSSAYEQAFNIDPLADGYLIKLEDSFILSDYKRNNFIEDLSVRKLEPVELFPLLKAENNLSKRERECLYHFVRGRTAKEIGEMLGLSKRTVEHYLAKTKDKMHVTCKAELIEKVLEGII